MMPVIRNYIRLLGKATFATSSNFAKLGENSDNQEVKYRMKTVFDMADQAGWITPKPRS